jgi:hypothetical protein
MKRGGLVALVILLVLGTCYVLPPSDLLGVGGPWYTDYRGSWSMDTHGSTVLYRRALFGFPLRVADDVMAIRFYEPDCLLYENGPMTTVFVACGRHGPARVIDQDTRNERRFHASDAGLRRAIDLRAENGVPMWTVERIPLERIRAAARGEKVVPIVESQPVDVNFRGPQGITPLLQATREGNVPAVSALLRAGADVDAADSNGVTATGIAAAGLLRDTTLVRVLLEARPDLERTIVGHTPLQRAAVSNDTAVFRLLLRAGADPCRRDDEGRTIVELGSQELTSVLAVRRKAYERCATR